MTWRPAPLALALLILLLPSAVEGRSLGSLQASSIAVGEGSVVGPLLGASWHPGGAQDDGSGSAFVLQAKHMELRIEHSNRTPSPLLPRPRTWNETRTLTNVTAQGLVGDAANRRLLALAGVANPNGATLSSSPDVAIEAAPDDMAFRDLALGGSPYAIAAGSGLQIAGAGPFSIQGAFRLVLDGFDATLASDQGPVPLHTRSDRHAYAESPVEPPIAGPLLFLGDDLVHEAVLDVDGAVVTFPADHAYVRSASLTAGDTRLTRASGSIVLGERSYVVQGEQVALQGSLQGELTRADGRVGARLSGEVDSFAIDGASVATPQAPAPWKGMAAALAVVAFAVVTIAIAAVVAGRVALRRLDEAMDHRDHATALTWARRLLWHPRFRQDATLAAAISLLALGRPGDARDHLSSRAWSPSRRATSDYLLARAEASLGNADEARLRLASSLEREPALAADAATDPVLARVVRGLRLPSEAYA